MHIVGVVLVVITPRFPLGGVLGGQNSTAQLKIILKIIRSKIIVSIKLSRILLCDGNLRHVKDKVMTIEGTIGICPPNKLRVNAINVAKKEGICVSIHPYLGYVSYDFLDLLEPIKNSI